MLDRPIKAIFSMPDSKGREAISLNTLYESLSALAQDPDLKAPLFSRDVIDVGEIHEDVLTPATKIVFALEGQWGRLEIEYTPGMDAVGNLFKHFDEALSDPSEALNVDVLKCTQAAFIQLLRKLPENLRDAMIGLMEETVFETVSGMAGKQIWVRVDRKAGRDQIAELHAQMSRDRMGAGRGPSVKPEAFLHRVLQAWVNLGGTPTEEELAEEMGIEARSFRKLITNSRFTWAEIREFLARGQKQEPE